MHALGIIFFHSRNIRKHRKGLSCISLPVTKVFDISPWYLPFFWFTPKGFFKKISGRYNAVLRNLPKTFCQRNQELQLNGQKGLATFFFNWKSRLLKYFLWKSKMHFRKTPLKNFQQNVEWRILFAYYQKLIKLFSFKRRFFPYVLLNTLNVVLRTLPKKFQQKVDNLTLNMQKSENL